MSFLRIYSDGSTFLDNISQVGNKTFSTGTGAVSLNGPTTIASSNSFTTGSGTVTIQGATLFAGIATTASGSASFDLSSASGIFKTTAGAVTIGSGAVSVTGTTTFSAGILNSGASAIDFSGGSGIFKTSTGSVTIGNGAISITGVSTFSNNVLASGSASIDFSGSTGTFKTTTGAVTIGGVATVTAAGDALIVNNHAKIDGYRLDMSAGALNGQALVYNGTSFVPTTPVGAVSSVSNSDTTLTISPTTGAVVASLNLTRANTWSTKQTFSSHIAVDGYTFDLSGGAVTNQALIYNGTNFVPTTVEGPVGTGSNDTQLTTTSSTTIATFTPTAQNSYVVFVYYRVITATTVLTITLTWTDGTGAQTSNIIPAATNATVGSYTAAPVYINATASAITVTATAGTANQVFVSCNITLV